MPNDRWVRMFVPVALVFIAAGIDRNYQTDLWHHLARGREIVEQRQLVNVDLFTFTVHGTPLRDVNWGWQVLFFLLYRLGGLALVQTVNAAVLAAVFAVLGALATRRSGSNLAATGACVFAFFGLWPLLLIRPQTLSFLLFVLVLAALEVGQHKCRWLLVPPLLMALWVNVHGGFPIGLVVIGAYALADLIGPWLRTASVARSPSDGEACASAVSTPWPMVLCLAASVLATLANPYGWHVYEYVMQTAGRASSRGIDEWLAPGLQSLTGAIFAVSLVAIVTLTSLTERRLTRHELCTLACLLPLACGSVRMVAWWLLALTPILAAQVATHWPALRDDEQSRAPSWGAAVTCLLLASAMAFSTPWLEAVNPVHRLPGRDRRVEDDLQKAADFLTEHGHRGRIFTRFAWGEYLAWALYPQFTVFMDGRIEIYPDDIWADYAAVTRGRTDWPAILDRHRVTLLVLDRYSSYHANLQFQFQYGAHLDWRQLYENDSVVIYQRLPR